MDIAYSSTRNSSVHPHSRVYVAGHQGMVGSALVRALRARGYANIVVRTHRELDLTNQAAVARFMEQVEPSYVFLAAGKVGGILANNSYRADFIYQNLAIETNVIHAAMRAGVKNLMFLGSSCIYPRDCPQPIREEYLLTGPFERTNEPYAVAKVAGLKLCEAYNAQHGTRYVSVMPTNLFGPNDNFDAASSHVFAALLRKAHVAKTTGSPVLGVWGSGNPRREFLHVDDLADAAVHLMQRDQPEQLINVGTGEDISIAEVAALVKRIVGYPGTLRFDTSKPDGAPRKLLDVGRLHALGWRHKTTLEDGIAATYRWLLENRATARL